MSGNSTLSKGPARASSVSWQASVHGTQGAREKRLDIVNSEDTMGEPENKGT